MPSLEIHHLDHCSIQITDVERSRRFYRDLLAEVRALPGVSAAAGVRSDHESSTQQEALAKAALGLLVQVREGSIAPNLDRLMPLLAAPGNRRCPD